MSASRLELQWNERLCIGVPAIDAEHRRLIELAGSLEAAFRSRPGKADVEAILSSMVTEAQAHFQHEELALADLRGSDADRHAQIHSEILESLSRTMAAFQQGGFSVIWLGKAAIIRRMLITHMLEEDLKHRNG